MVTVQLRQSLTGSAGHLDAIADGKMDLALVSISSSPSRLVAVRELTHEHMVFVCDSSHPLAHHDRVQLADLAGQDFIPFPRGWGIRQRLDAVSQPPASSRRVPTKSPTMRSPPSSFDTGWQRPFCPSARPTGFPICAKFR
jgi:DNA-binding transcriptional LysR family regulator